MADFFAGLDPGLATALVTLVLGLLGKGLQIAIKAIVGHFTEFGRLKAREIQLLGELEQSQRETRQQRRAKLRAKRLHLNDLKELRRRGLSSIPPRSTTTKPRE